MPKDTPLDSLQTGLAAPLISMEGVHKTFPNGTVAVRDMNLSIEAGEFVSFLGPSGCGKSTAMKMISGLLPVSAGAIEVNGHPAGKGSDGTDIGFVFQEATLMPWATVFDNVYLPLRLKGVSKAKARPQIEEMLAAVGLSRFANSYPRELSGGMKMRVSIARAMVTKPRLLLMDEPFAALDEMTRFKLNNDVMRLQQELGLTVIFVTHSVFESVYLSSRVVVMASRPGRVVEDIALPYELTRNEHYRTTSEYADRCRMVGEALERTLENVDH